MTASTITIFHYIFEYWWIKWSKLVTLIQLMFYWAFDNMMRNFWFDYVWHLCNTNMLALFFNRKIINVYSIVMKMDWYPKNVTEIGRSGKFWNHKRWKTNDFASVDRMKIPANTKTFQKIWQFVASWYSK